MVKPALCGWSAYGSNRRITKTLMVMKWIAFFLTAACLNVTAAGISQTVSFSGKNVPLKKIFQEIEKQTGYAVTYTDNILIGTKAVSIQVKEASLQKFLDIALADQPVKYTIDYKTILLSRRSTPVVSLSLNNRSASAGGNELLLSGTLKGKVVDTAGRPLSGASVSIKKSKTSGITNMDGEFDLSVDEGDVLFISFVGYETRSLTVTASLLATDKPLVITLRPSITRLEDVEITYNTGYQAIPKERITGSFTIIDNKTLNQQVGTNILKRLDGVASGFQFINKNDRNRKLGIAIRGLSTIEGPLDPIIVLDGFLYEGDINNINPNDIDNITLLKDAAAASIWGARAGNGVIVITTKKGRFNQKATISVTSNVIVTEKPDLYRLPRMTAADYIEVETFLFNKGYFNNQISSSAYLPLTPAVEILLNRRNNLISASDSANQLNELKKIDTRDDYHKYIYTRPLTQTYSVNLLGGNNNNAYTISAAYDQSLGETYEKFKKLNVRIRNTYRPFSNLQVTLAVYYTNSTGNSGRLLRDNSVQIGSRQVPYLRLADDQGNALPIATTYRNSFTDTIGNGKLLDWRNYPLDEYKYQHNTNKLQELYTTVDVQYTILKGLTAVFRYQHQNQESTTEDLINVQSFRARDLINQFTQLNRATGELKYNLPPGDILKLDKGTIQSHTLSGLLNFNRSWGNHEIAAVLGAETRQVRSTGVTGNMFYGYKADPLTFAAFDPVTRFPNLLTGGTGSIPNGRNITDFTSRFVSVFGNASYTWRQRYIVSMSGRRDGSNVFGANTNDKWKPLWSTGLAWVLSNEDFYKVAAFPLLKLRASYGIAGNIDLSKSALPVGVYLSSRNTNMPTVRINSINNPDLRWEQVKTVNLALDFTVKSNLLTGTIEYFRKRSTDLYGAAPYDYTGYGGSQNITRNVADIESKGWEITINSKNIDKAFKWNTSLLYNNNTSKTLKYFGPTSDRITTLTGAGGIIVPVNGMPLYAIGAYKWAGLDASGDPQGFVDGKTSKDYEAIFNEAYLKGISGNYEYMGPAIPSSFGSLINTFQYKGFSMQINIAYKLGYYFKRPAIYYPGLEGGGNIYGDYAKRWKKPGDELTTIVPSFIYPSNFNRNTFWNGAAVNVLKADHIRLQYINLSYTLGEQTFTRAGLPFRQLTLSANVQNIGILWMANEEKIDPDYPDTIRPGRMYSIGINATF